MEGGYAVAWAEFVDVGPDGVDCAGDVVAGVVGAGLPKWQFPVGELRVSLVGVVVEREGVDWVGGIEEEDVLPVFGVGAADLDFDDDLAWPGAWDGAVDYLDLVDVVDYSFFHCCWDRVGWRVGWNVCLMCDV